VPLLTRRLLASSHPFPPDLTLPTYGLPPERVLQLGEGAFLRGFVDWMLDRLNCQGLFRGSVVVVKPRGGVKVVESFNAQDGLFTLLLRGLRDGQVVRERHLVGAIRRVIDPYQDHDALLAVARSADLRFVVSNTTEAGIACSEADRRDDRPPASFPAKLTAVLHERWRHFSADPRKGLIMLPCELIERNGSALRGCVLETAGRWELPPAFTAWVETACVFANTLVDRIVSGRPGDDEARQLAEELGYDDPLLIAGEPYHAWVIEAPAHVARELPLREAGLNVTWTDDVEPYRARKVRVLNGAHTMLTPVALLAGHDLVRQSLSDPLIADFVRRGLFDEILPVLPGDRAEVRAFAEAVLERFANPFVDHRLLDIALNSTSKFVVRLLPSITEHAGETGRLPPRLVFALAALLRLYKVKRAGDGAHAAERDAGAYTVRDDPARLAVFAEVWARFDAGTDDLRSIVARLLSVESLWSTDLTRIAGLPEAVTMALSAIMTTGVRRALMDLGAGG
jgi:tagaturonate reductase